METQIRPAPERRWHQYSLAKLMLAVTAISLAVSICTWWHLQFVEAQRLNNRILAAVDSLEHKRPAEMTREQWENAVGWTRNLVCNSSLRFDADLDELRRFEDDLERKSEGSVDLRTILWIWDRMAEVTRAGKDYQRFRQRMLDDISRCARAGSSEP